MFAGYQMCVAGPGLLADGGAGGKPGGEGRDLVKFQEKLCNKRNYNEGRDSSGGNTPSAGGTRRLGGPGLALGPTALRPEVEAWGGA